MNGDGGILTIELFAGLVTIAAVAALITARLSMPYSVVLVLAGLVVAFFVPNEIVVVSPDLILAVLIPGLVFEAAFRLDLVELRRTFGIVVILAVPGVLVTAGVVAFVVSSLTGLDPALGFLLGAMLSATDPVAVVDLFKRLRAPSRLATAVDAEALLNDGTGVVLFTIALVAVTRPVGLVEGSLSFVAVVAVSTVIGLAAGALAVRLMMLTDDQWVQTAISLVAAYGTYLVALRAYESGIIATVVAGIVIGYAGQRGLLPRATLEALETLWGFAVYLITALTFLLIGLVIGPDLVIGAAPVIVSGYVAITLARALVVYGLIGGAERARPGPSLLPLGYLHVIFWAGLRGAIAIALVLALPADLPERGVLTGAVFGIVLLSILLQGTTASWVIRRAGVVGERPTGVPVALPVIGE